MKYVYGRCQSEFKIFNLNKLNRRTYKREGEGEDAIHLEFFFVILKMGSTLLCCLTIHCGIFAMSTIYP